MKITACLGAKAQLTTGRLRRGISLSARRGEEMMSDRRMCGTAMLLLLSGWVPVLGGQAAERPAQTADKSDAANAKQVAGAAPSSDATAYSCRWARGWCLFRRW